MYVSYIFVYLGIIKIKTAITECINATVCGKDYMVKCIEMCLAIIYKAQLPCVTAFSGAWESKHLSSAKLAVEITNITTMVKFDSS